MGRCVPPRMLWTQSRCTCRLVPQFDLERAWCLVPFERFFPRNSHLRKHWNCGALFPLFSLPIPFWPQTLQMPPSRSSSLISNVRSQKTVRRKKNRKWQDQVHMRCRLVVAIWALRGHIWAPHDLPHFGHCQGTTITLGAGHPKKDSRVFFPNSRPRPKPTNLVNLKKIY